MDIIFWGGALLVLAFVGYLVIRKIKMNRLERRRRAVYTGEDVEKEFNMPNLSAKLILLPVLIILLLSVLFGSIYRVQPGSRAVIFRLGRIINVVDSGIHVKLPFIDSCEKVVTDKIMRYEFGYRTIEVGPPAKYETLLNEEQMITQDGKILSVDWVMQYMIKGPENYIIMIPQKQKARDKAIRDIAEAEFRNIINITTMDDVLTIGKERIASDARLRIQAKLDTIHAGINVVSIQLQDVDPPQSVVASFNEVNSAKSQKDQKILEANKYANERHAEALGAAMKEINDAEAYKARRISVVEGDTKRVLSLLPDYNKNPELVKGSLRLDALDGLWKSFNIVLLDASSSNNVNLVPLDKILKNKNQ